MMHGPLNVKLVVNTIPTDWISRPSNRSNAVFPKVCFADPRGSATGYQKIRGYISLMTAFNFTFSKLKE